MEQTTAYNKRNFIILIAAFAAVYVIWGSTYLAIKYAIDMIPSFLMAGVRFLVAGGILYTVARFSPGYEKPKAVHWRTSFIVGALLLGIGNGGVVVAEHYISSSLAALLVATTPFFMVLIGWLFMGKGRPNYKVTLGLLIGFVGVAMLISGGASAESAGNSQLFGIFLIIFATLGWAIGSLYGTHAPAPKSTFLAAGIQMLSGGLILMVMSLLAGEWTTFDYNAVSSTSWFALIYLIFIGALVAYTAYSWLLKNASPSTISTYAYVNPAVAVFLGWAIAGESLTGQMLVGAAIIVGSVVLITSQKKTVSDNMGEVEVHTSNTPTGSHKPVSASA